MDPQKSREKATVTPKVSKTKTPVAKKTVATRTISDKATKLANPRTPMKPKTSAVQQTSSVVKKLKPNNPQVQQITSGIKKSNMSPSITKSAKKPTWKRKPKPAHSGVPVPEKLKKLMASKELELSTKMIYL